MLLANLQNVTKSYGAQVVLRGVSFRIGSGQKLGLIGPNGSGKTTILRILVGQEQPSDGNAVTARGVRVGYVPQHVEYQDDLTVADCVLVEHRRLSAALREQELRLAAAGGGELDTAMRAYQRALDAFERVGSHRFPQRAEAMLDALGLAGRADQPVGSLSGGEKNVLAMAEALLSEPDLLLLDEPANHLDYQGVAWLEDFLVRFRGAEIARGSSSPKWGKRLRARASHERPGTAAELERHIGEAERGKVLLEERIEAAFRRRNRREARHASRELGQLQQRLDRLYEEWLAQSE